MTQFEIETAAIDTLLSCREDLIREIARAGRAGGSRAQSLASVLVSVGQAIDEVNTTRNNTGVKPTKTK